MPETAEYVLPGEPRTACEKSINNITHANSSAASNENQLLKKTVLYRVLSDDDVAETPESQQGVTNK